MINVICDECRYRSSFDLDSLKKSIVKLGRKRLTLFYLTCPMCKKIYRVCLKDAHSLRLTDDLEKLEDRARTNANNGIPNVGIINMIIKKKKQIKSYVDELNKSFAGTFTFAASENNEQDKIIYLP